jgi:hypothetical protein
MVPLKLLEGVQMKGLFLNLIITCWIILNVGCGKNPVAIADKGDARLTIWAHVVKNSSSLAKSTNTTWDSLVIRISSAPTIDTISRTIKFNNSDPFATCTLSGIPAGKGRLVEVWTKNSKGSIILTAPGKKVDLISGEIKTIDFVLLPKCGSVYVDIANIPVVMGDDSIRFIFATFAFDGQKLSDSISRAKNAFLSIDNVPDGVSGTLYIVGISKTHDTLYHSSFPLTFNAMRDTAFSAALVKVSTRLSLQIITSLPSATVISISMDSQKDAGLEKGPCIISEIMYAANDSEYVEIYNPLANDTVFDTLILDIDGTYRYFASVSCKAKEFFVFGRKNLPWVDATHQISSALDLTSGGNMTITLRAKDSSIIDRVSFQGGSNKQEWPNISGKKSIVLDSLVSDPLYNNFGKNWQAAQTTINKIDGTYSSPMTTQCGTPGYGGR